MDRAGVSPLLALVLYMAIALGTIGLIWTAATPMVDRMQDTGTIESQIDFLQRLDGAIDEVASHGRGSVRVLRHGFPAGSYRIDTANNSVTYLLRTDSPLVSRNTTVRQGDVVLSATNASATNRGQGNKTVTAALYYTTVQLFSPENSVPRGSYRFVVRNAGIVSGRTNVSLRVR